MSELATRRIAPLVPESDEVPPAIQNNAIGKLMEKLAAQGTPESVAAMRELTTLFREEEDRSARRSFAADFKALQGECKAVQASKAIPDRDGGTRYTFAPYEEIMAQVQPLLDKYGFSVSFDSDYKNEPLRVEAWCILLHVSGHEERRKASIRVGKGPPGCTESQSDGAAMTYAKRYALCYALNIRIDHDTDARNDGDTIDPADAEDLQRRVGLVCGGDQAQMNRYLRLGGAKTWAEIREHGYRAIIEQLEREESKSKGGAAERPDASPPPAKPCPCGFGDAGAWHDAMLEEMESRWGCDRVASKHAMGLLLKKGGYTSHLDAKLDATKRKAAWEKLVGGAFDAAYGPKGTP